MNISNIINNSRGALNESLGSLSTMPEDAKEMVIELLKSKTVHSFISTQSTFESFGYTNLKQIEDRVKMYVKSSDKMVAAVLAKSSDGQFFAYTHNNVGMLGKFNKASTETDVFSYNNGKIVRRSKGYREFEKNIASVGTAWIVFADMGLPGLQQARADKRETAPLRSIGERHVIKITSGMSAKAIESVIRHVSEVGNQVMIGNTKYESRQMADSVNKIFYNALIDNNLTVEVCHMISDGPKRNVMLMLDFVDMTFFVK